MSHKQAYHTLRDTHTYILWQHAYSKSVASCRRSLREQNTTCPLIFLSRAKRGSPSNWSHLHLLSHTKLNCSSSAMFYSTIYPRLCCSFPSLLLRVWSPRTRLLAIILNRITALLTRVIYMLYLESWWWWDLMRFRFGLRWTVLPDVAAVVAWEEFGQWQCVYATGWEVNISLSLCLHYLILSPLCAIVLLLVSWAFGCRQIDRRQADARANSNHCWTWFRWFLCKHKPMWYPHRTLRLSMEAADFSPKW